MKSMNIIKFHENTKLCVPAEMGEVVGMIMTARVSGGVAVLGSTLSPVGTR